MKKVIFQIMFGLLSMFAGAVAFSVYLQVDKDFRDMAVSYYEKAETNI